MTTPNILSKEDAEVLKILAEAEKARKEGEAAEAQRDLHIAEARKRAAEARKEEYYAENARVSTEATLRQEKISLSADHHHKTFQFLASVYDEPVSACIAQMAVWHRNEPDCEMNIIIDSPGGSVIDGMHLFDQITAYSKRPWDTKGVVKGVPGTHSTTITVRGYAASMAGILLQAADKRIIGPESYLMIHQVASFAHGKIGEIKDEVDFLDKISDRVTDIFVRRAQASGVSPQKMNNKRFKTLWDRKDVWLTSEEALEYGFVDEIG